MWNVPRIDCTFPDDSFGDMGKVLRFANVL
jgi:hypothetical protein